MIYTDTGSSWWTNRRIFAVAGGFLGLLFSTLLAYHFLNLPLVADLGLIGAGIALGAVIGYLFPFAVDVTTWIVSIFV